MQRAVQTVRGPRFADRSTVRRIGAITLIIVAIAALVLAGRLLRTGAFVSRITVVNTSGYAVEIQLTNAAHDGWMRVGSVEPRATTEVLEVYDQGPTWVLQFGYESFTAEVTMSRSDLRRSGWRVEVPQELVAVLREHQTPRTPVNTTG